MSPEGLRGIIFENAGENGILCVTDGTEGKVGDVSSKTCGVKVKAKHIMTAIKFTGYHTFTAYAHCKHLPTMHIMSMG